MEIGNRFQFNQSVTAFCRFRDGATLSVLAEALDDLREKLYGVKDIGFTGDSKDICQYAADLLGPSKYFQAMFAFLNENHFRFFQT